MNDNWCRVAGVLTLRDREEGIKVANELEELHLREWLLKPGEYVLLVHGYNVSQAEARESYARFRWWLEHLTAWSRVLELHWPGDRKWGKISGAVYPAKIGVAKECGRLLADWIAKNPGIQLHIVAHSLGCRLVLQAVRELRRRSSQDPSIMSRISSVNLMAAAVPARHLSPSTLGPWPTDAFTWKVLFSRGDTTLRGLFPLGQLARWDGAASSAVGAFGHPLHLWKPNHALEMFQEVGPDTDPRFYKHGDYWPAGPEEAKLEGRLFWNRWVPPIPRHPKNEGESAKCVAESLGVMVDRSLPKRKLTPARSFPEHLLGTLSTLQL